MIGVYYSSTDSIENFGVEFKFSIKKLNAKNGSVLLVAPDYRIVDSVHEENNDWLIIDGEVYDENYKITALELFNKIKNYDFSFEKLNGEFFISYFIDDKLFFVSDRMSQRQHCIVNSGGNISIAPNPGFAIKLSGIDRKINKKALYFFLVAKKLRLGRDTIWENCSVIPPATKLSVQSSGISESCYWSLDYSDEEVFDVDKLTAIYKNAVNLRAKSKVSKSLTITGGLDSRTMLCAVENDNLENINCITTGQKGCTEIEFAKQVTNVIDVNHEISYLEAEDILKEECISYFENEDIDLLIQGQWNKFLNDVNTGECLLHGLDLDVTIGGIYLTDKVCNIKTDDELLEYIKAESFVNLSDAKTLFKLDVFEQYKDVVDEEITSVFSKLKGSNPVQKYDYYILMHSMNRVILQRYRAIRNHVETTSPMYDIRLMEYYRKLNFKLRANYKLFHPFMIGLCKQASKIPYQRTNLPANTAVCFWSESQKIEREREELYRKIACKTKGEINIHYNGYYTNVDEWMRFNKSWANAIDALLFSKESLIVKHWVNKEFLKKIINEHRSHKVSHMATILRLMSAEIYLRQESGLSSQEIAKTLRTYYE